MPHDAFSSLNPLNTLCEPATMSAETGRLIVFARFPQPGQAKTRLQPALGAERAAALQESLTRRTLRVAKRHCESRLCRLEVRFAGGDADAMARRYGDAACYVPQRGSDLGERLEQAVVAAFAAGDKRVVVVGTDSPDLDADRLHAAFQALAVADVVLGPAEDGGYYLIGMSRLLPDLFRGIAWGSEHVLEQTVARAYSRNQSVRLLPKLSDVDYAEDLVACRRYPADFSGVLPQTRSGLISIVVPALNEEQCIAETLIPLQGRDEVEVIVADGGSVDATPRIAADLGAQVVAARRGRGRQMNAGAALASGETLLFLHADSRLPPDFPAAMRAVRQRGYIAGAFRLRIDSPNRLLRWIERAANLRARFLQLPYGDQALFLQADVFYDLGGFPHWPLMEDYDLCRRLKRQGPIGLARESVTTSPRRWERLGICRTTLVNQLIILGFHLGVTPERLAKWYAGKPGPEKP